MKGKSLTSIGGAGLWNFFLFWVELFLLLRLALHFFAVGASNGFAAWVYHSTDAMVAPFRGVFGNSNMIPGHPHFVDLQTLFVMAAYAIFVPFMVWLLAWFHITARRK